MKSLVHTGYLAVLLAILVSTALIIGLRGYDYYLTSADQRPFHPRYDHLKPTGFEGHGYGIVGSLMIVFGVTMYSARKRLRFLRNLGKIKYFLKFHIFLCILGPILVTYHTTFKIGGLVAISYWCMVAVVASGFIGRYLYVQIPKGIYGNELSAEELAQRGIRISELLQKTYGIGPEIIGALDKIAIPPKKAAEMSFWEATSFFVVSDLTRRLRIRWLVKGLRGKGVTPQTAQGIRLLANQRAVLVRKIAFLEQLRQVFHYWHVIHLPFSIVMFVILFLHVGVAVAFRYTWIW